MKSASPDKFWRRGTLLSIDAKSLYAVLATFADYRTGETFVSNARLELETGYGRDKVKTLLSELERADFIQRRRELRGNLKAKRHIKCLKYVSSPIDGNPDYRPDGLVFRATDNQPTILTPVKSSVKSSVRIETELAMSWVLQNLSLGH